MSLNLTVPARDSPTKERTKGGTRRAKSPGGNRPRGPRAKSKSPNPSFCSVLSRVKDWELGAFTPKTALADNVDVCRSNVPFSDSDRSQSPQSEAWKPSPTGSPMPGQTTEDAGAGTEVTASDAVVAGGGVAAGDDGHKLTKKALDASNLGRTLCDFTVQ